MGERYSKWVEDSTSNQIINSYGLQGLADPIQNLLEELVEITNPVKIHKINKLAKQIGSASGISSGSVKRAAGALRNLNYGVRAGGRDPLLDEGQHYNGGR